MEIENMEKPNKTLISAKVFANRLGGRSVKSLDRLLSSGAPGLPQTRWLNQRRVFDESECDAFIETVLRGAAPDLTARREHASGARKAKSEAARS
jgi:hypothetical protein